jgi:hypothetical protein
LTDVDDAGGQAVVHKIESAGGEAIFLHHDVTLEDRGPANDRNRRKPATSLATYECGIKRNAVSVEEIERHARSLSE